VPDESMKVNLMPGFDLMEEEHYVHLFYEGRVIASFFQSVAHPEIISAVAEAYICRSTP